MCPKNPYAEALTPSAMVFESRAFGRSLGLHEVLRVGVSVLIKSGGETRAFSPACEDIARGQPSASLERGFHQTLN